MTITALALFLTFFIILRKFQIDVLALDFIRFTKNDNFSRLTCPDSEIVFSAENVTSKELCAALCAKAPSCVGFFRQTKTNTCVGCSFFAKHDARFLDGTQFYGQGCFELPPVINGFAVFDNFSSNNKVEANVTCDPMYKTSNKTITCTPEEGWTPAICVKNCYLDGPVNYAGKRNWTVSGRTCQRWDVQFPHKHDVDENSNFPEATIQEASNYCRYPGHGEDRPWCYTVDENVRWEYCDITQCT